jgi:ParB-like chromosome segregation protein Spo0J
MVVDGLRRKAAAHLLGLEPLNVHRGDRAEEPPVEAGKDVLDERGPVLGLD